jgi:hypothetical protein
MGQSKYAPQDRYHKDKCVQVGLRFVKTTDADIIAHLEAQPNKQGYIKALIRADMARSSKTDKD